MVYVNKVFVLCFLVLSAVLELYCLNGKTNYKIYNRPKLRSHKIETKAYILNNIEDIAKILNKGDDYGNKDDSREVLGLLRNDRGSSESAAVSEEKRNLTHIKTEEVIDSSGGDDTKVKDTLRSNNKVKCKEACKEAYVEACNSHKCKKKLGKAFKRSCKKSCKKRF